MSLRPGQIIDAYRVVKTLGSGSSGAVYQVRHTITGRSEALKVLLENSPDSSGRATAFLREIRVHASLNHPNIVAVHNALWTGEHLLLVLELVEGETLESLLRRGRLPLAKALDFARQALSGLEYAHAHGVVHCDISPGNLLVAAEGRLKIMDFGLAVPGFRDRGDATGGPVGSPHYMSPEHVRGAGSVTPRSDIYSLGAVLYHMATGRTVYEGSEFELMRCQLEEEAMTPSMRDASLPAGLDPIILKALAKHPGNRYPGARQFLDALVSSRDPIPIRAARPAKVRVRYPLAFVSGFAAVILALIASVRYSIPGLNPDQPKPPVEKPAMEDPKPAPTSAPAPIPRAIRRARPKSLPFRGPSAPGAVPEPTLALTPPPPAAAPGIVVPKPLPWPTEEPRITTAAPPEDQDKSIRKRNWFGRTVNRIKRLAKPDPRPDPSTGGLQRSSADTEPEP